MRNVYLDTSVLLLAVGGPHRSRESARGILSEVGGKRVRAHTSVETIQEFVFHLLRRGDTQAVERGRGMSSLCVLHPFDEDVLFRSLDLVEAGAARGRDAVHAATALGAGLNELISADRDFDGVPGLHRIDPSAWKPS